MGSSDDTNEMEGSTFSLETLSFHLPSSSSASSSTSFNNTSKLNARLSLGIGIDALSPQTDDVIFPIKNTERRGSSIGSGIGTNESNTSRSPSFSVSSWEPPPPQSPHQHILDLFSPSSGSDNLFRSLSLSPRVTPLPSLNPGSGTPRGDEDPAFLRSPRELQFRMSPRSPQPDSEHDDYLFDLEDPTSDLDPEQSPGRSSTPSSPSAFHAPGYHSGRSLVHSHSYTPGMPYEENRGVSPRHPGLNVNQMVGQGIGLNSAPGLGELEGVPYTASFGEHPYGEHPSRTLFVRNINSNVEDDELAATFGAHGDIRSMYTQCKHRGFVMISYYDIRHAKTAMRNLQGKVLRRRKLDIHYSIPKDNPSEKDQNQGTLVIFNLDPSTTNEELKGIFGHFGEIKEIRETPNKKHHKFIEFYDVRDSEKAMKSLNKTEIKGKKIKIEPSRPGGARKNQMNPNGVLGGLELAAGEEDVNGAISLLYTSHSAPPALPLHYNVTNNPNGVNPPLSPSHSPTPSPILHTPIPPIIPPTTTTTATTATATSPSPNATTNFHPPPILLASYRLGGGGGGTRSPQPLPSAGPLSPTSSSQSSSTTSNTTTPSPTSSPGRTARSDTPNTIVNSPTSSLNSNVVGFKAIHMMSPDASGGNNGGSVSVGMSVGEGRGGMGGMGGSGRSLNQLSLNFGDTLSLIPSPGPSSVSPANNVYLSPRISPRLSPRPPPGNFAAGTSPAPGGPVAGQTLPLPTNSPPYVPPSSVPASSTTQASTSRWPSSPVSHTSLSFVPDFHLHLSSLTNSDSNPSSPTSSPRSPHLNSPSLKNTANGSSVKSPRGIQSPNSSSLPPSYMSKPTSSTSSSTKSPTPQAEDKTQYTLSIERVKLAHDSRTTLMIRNIPNKYSQKMLLAAVDERHRGSYDFFYLPIDFKNKCNVGYAFINFINYRSIVPFYEEFNNKKWEKFNSEKVCEITYARIQGKAALIGHFQNSSLMSYEDKKCRPIILHSGEGGGSRVVGQGRRVGRRFWLHRGPR